MTSRSERRSDMVVVEQTVDLNQLLVRKNRYITSKSNQNECTGRSLNAQGDHAMYKELLECTRSTLDFGSYKLLLAT